MRSLNELNLMGRVGSVKPFGKTAKVSVATDRRRKVNDEWQSVTEWTEVTILKEKTAKWVCENVGKGDLVFAKARVINGSYEKDGEPVYTVEILAERFVRLAKKGEEQPDQLDDDEDDIPF
ncbi:single-stranded DNA-binding protein [Microvirga alba]|uniref:Single-stranded DNA-binding protein n=1 Tax=Microvirga alba TaxID=2791025 RepID=A0A931BV10_9HYPH|nr:single-stranded DNA-binding protein [Microvirga alba]MBF9235635.1 single-stranded DNA-binding protein [Microvirga alba]